MLAGCAAEELQYIDSHSLQERILPPATPVQKPAVPEKEVTLPSGPLTLEHAINIALANNHTLKLSTEDVGIAEQQVNVARSLFLPQVTAGYGFDRRDRDVIQGFGSMVVPIAEKEFQRAELGVQMTIWDFGRSLGTYPTGTIR